ncbi:component of the polarisome [Puccinia graminis f. sp. tritici]|uniref:Component of the polarisome n=1 Tax=Puccinia graminis f. sp. tritici TaxID=56615 RepID=A0A5B0RGH7_PUCGR|nr:component of the polarisome [Puccinia graminis f. sp. tritici]
MNAATGVITTDMVVPDKSTLVVENNDDAYDDQSVDVNKLEPPLRTASIDQPDPRDILKAPAPHGYRPRSGSLSSIKYLSHKRNGSDSHIAINRSNNNGSKVSVNEYDRQISTMQTKIINLEKELRETQLNSSRSTSNSARLEECEEEILHWKQQCEEQKHQIKTIQANLLDERKSKSQSAEQEIQQLKRQISDLNQRLQSHQTRPTSDSNNRSDDSVVERLKSEVVELIDELRQMHSRQDLLLAEQDRFQETIRDLENTVDLHKRRYEAAKTELRDLKRSSTIYAPKEFLPNEKLPLTQNGAIVDIHFTSFTASIDDLLRSGRSNVSNELISVMRRVIDTVSTIDEDIQQFELNPNMSGRLNLEEQESLDTMKTRINATLSNLITASKNHVVSLGLSPISLLDAAASHLSFSMVELVQLVGMRRATEAEIEMSETLNAHSKYDDDDSHQNGGAQTTASKPLRPTNNGISPNHTPGIGSLGRRSDDSPAPLRINKDRDRDFPRNQGAGASPKEEHSGKMNGFLGRSRGPGALATNLNQPSLNGRNLNEKSPGGLGSRTQLIASKFEDLRSPSGFDGSNASDLRDSASGSSSTNPDKVFDSPPRAGMLNRAFRNVPSVPMRHDFEGQGSRNPSDSRSARTETARSNEQSVEITADSDEDVEKLKVYLETQTESIVSSIQSLLTTIRGTAQASTAATDEMDRNLNQIIKIVSAIVDRCSSSTSSARPTDDKTQRILAELTENCQKLSQMQDGGFHNHNQGQHGFSKHVKQAMAAASFGVAKALKELNAHVSGVGEESIL